MSKISSIDRTFLRIFREEAEKTLEALGTKYGISISLGNASFTANNASFKLQLATTGTDGVANTKEITNFKLYAAGFGLQETDLNREFIDGGKKYKIVGLLPRSYKNPIVVERADGKQFKFPADRLVAILKLQTSK